MSCELEFPFISPGMYAPDNLEAQVHVTAVTPVIQVSLLYQVYTHESSVNYLSESRFRCLTIVIVSISLIIGILVPNIEFVLGIVGSTIGVMICLIFPTVFFISISSKNTNERLVAQVKPILVHNFFLLMLTVQHIFYI